MEESGGCFVSLQSLLNHVGISDHPSERYIAGVPMEPQNGVLFDV